MSDQNGSSRKLAVFMAMGFECVGLVTAAVLLGRYCDNQYGWKGLGAAAGAIVGVVGWVTHLIVVLKSAASDSK
jgi:hypothetical protein